MEDQKQHVELTRNVAQRFNHVYGDVLKVPEPYIPKMGARVMSLNQPDTKMSKSIPEGCVFLMDKPEDILRKFKRAITDSDTERCVRFDRENKPGVSNLMSIYSAVTGRSFEAIEAEFDGKGYGAFKPVVGEAVVEMLRPIQEETRRLLSDKAYLESVYRAGAEKASYVAEKTLRKVYKRWASWPGKDKEQIPMPRNLDLPSSASWPPPGGGPGGGPGGHSGGKNLAIRVKAVDVPKDGRRMHDPHPAWADWPSSWASCSASCSFWT